MRDRSGSAHVSTKQTRSISARSAQRDHTLSVARGEGYKDVNEKLKAVKLSKVKTKPLAQQARKGEGDHHIPNLRPKHLFTGKVKANGKRDRR